MAENKVKQWTEAEKLGVLFQIIEKGGAIPWKELTLPEGRTMKAVQVMIDKEKTRMKKARAEETGAQGDKDDGTPADEGKKTKDKPKTGKRKAADGGDEAPAKKPRAPRVKKVRAAPDVEKEEADEGEPDIKDEVTDEDDA